MPTDQRPYWGAAERLLQDQVQHKWGSFSWITVRALLSSINDQVSRGAPSLVRELRTEWMARPAVVEARIANGLVVDRTDCSHFVVIGDPGEQDASQYVVAIALADTVATARTSSDPITAIVVCSDVIYPSGDINDYVDGYYVPNRAIIDVPTYALPGNHDWYDGLTGFMWHWCGQERLPSSVYGPQRGSTPSWTFRLFWRRASHRRRRLDLVRRRQERWSAQQPGAARPGPLQPAPYYAIELRDVLLVCIDTGIDGSIDHEQGQWLVEVSRRPGKPKILLTGKPLLVNATWHPCPIWSSRLNPSPVPDTDGGASFTSVLDIVQDPRHGYVATVGGDIHNYQRYSPAGGLLHVVSGGGGAYLSATHPVQEALQVRAGLSEGGRAGRAAGASGTGSHERNGPRPERLYPEPAESLAHFSGLFLPRVFRLVRALALVAVGFGMGWLLGWWGSQNGHHPEPGRSLAMVAVSVAALFTVRILLPAKATKTRWFRAGVAVNAGLSGVALALVPWWALPPAPAGPTAATGGHAPATRVLAVAVALAAGLCLVGWALRWTSWWRPARRDRPATTSRPWGEALRPPSPLTPDSSGRAALVGVLMVIGAVGAFPASGDVWVTAALVLTAFVAGWGWGRPRRTASGKGRASWVRRGPAIAYAVQSVDVVVVAVRLLFPDHRADVVYAGAVALLVPVAVAGVALVAVLALSAVAALVLGDRIGGPSDPLARSAPAHHRSRFRSGWGRVGWLAPWLFAVLLAAGLVLAGRHLPDIRASLTLLGPDHERHGLSVQTTATGRRVGFTAAVTLTVGVATPIVLDTLRRWLPRSYKYLAAAVVAAVVATVAGTGGFDGPLPKDLAGVVAVLAAIALTVVAAHLFFLNAFTLLFDRDLYRSDAYLMAHPLLSPEQAGEVLRWRVGSAGMVDPAGPSSTSRRRAEIVFPGVGEPQGPLQKAVSEVFDSDRPPFAKNFLVVSTTPEQVDVRAVFVTGDRHAPDPDHFTVALT